MSSPPLSLLDGLPVFAADRSPDALQRLGLVFRAGQADETLPTAGVLELLGIWATQFDVPPTANVGFSLEGYFLTIEFVAPPDQLPGLVDEVCRRLAAPDPDRLARMASLMIDDPLPPPAVLADALLNRFGAQGPGLAAFRGMGLPRMRPDATLALAAKAFSAGNAAIASDAVLPDGLRVRLAPGPRWEAREPEPQVIVPYPIGYPHRSDTEMIMTALVPHGMTAAVAENLLTIRVRNALRHSLGLVYSPSGVRVSFVHTDLIGVHTDVPAEAAAAAVRETFGAIQAMAGHGVTDDELRAGQSQAYRAFDDERLAHRAGWWQAREYLTGEEPSTLATLRARLEAVTADQVSNVIDGMIDTFMMGVPGPTPTSVAAVNWDKGPSEPEPLVGRRFHVRSGVADRKTAPRLVVTPDGVLWRSLSVTPSGAHGLSVPVAAAAAVLAWPDGARQLIRQDGYRATFEPQFWRKGHDLTKAVDALAPADLVIGMPARDPDDIGGPRPWLVRLLTMNVGRGFRLLWRGVLALSVLLVVAGLVVVVAAATTRSAGGVTPVIVGLVAAFSSWRAMQKRDGGASVKQVGPRLEHPSSRGAGGTSAIEAGGGS